MRGVDGLAGAPHHPYGSTPDDEGLVEIPTSIGVSALASTSDPRSRQRVRPSLSLPPGLRPPLSLLVAQRLYRVEAGGATCRVVAKHEADEHAYASGEADGAERDGWHEHRATGAA